jgi:hypothetical protein
MTENERSELTEEELKELEAELLPERTQLTIVRVGPANPIELVEPIEPPV